MSITKRHMEEEESKNQFGVNILIEAGILEKCDGHEEIIFQSGDNNIQNAYKLANSKWETHYSSIFQTRREMTDAILAASKNSDYANDGCEICRSRMDNDD